MKDELGDFNRVTREETATVIYTKYNEGLNYLRWYLVLRGL